MARAGTVWLMIVPVLLVASENISLNTEYKSPVPGGGTGVMVIEGIPLEYPPIKASYPRTTRNLPAVAAGEPAVRLT